MNKTSITTVGLANFTLNSSASQELKINETLDDMQENFIDNMRKRSTKRIVGVGEDPIYHNFVSPKMKIYSTMKWMRSKCYSKAKKEYMLNDEELRQTLAIETLFLRFDSD